MKAFTTENIRNLAVIGHGDAGKTQLVSSNSSVRFCTLPAQPRAGDESPKGQPLLITTKIQLSVKFRSIIISLTSNTKTQR